MERICGNCVDAIELGGLEPCKSCGPHNKNFRPKKEEQMPELKSPTRKQVLKVATMSSMQNESMKILYPAAFEDGPIKMAGGIKNEKGDTVAWAANDGKSIVFSSCYVWKHYEEDRDYSERVTPTRR